MEEVDLIDVFLRESLSSVIGSNFFNSDVDFFKTSFFKSLELLLLILLPKELVSLLLLFVSFVLFSLFCNDLAYFVLDGVVICNLLLSLFFFFFLLIFFFFFFF